MVDKDAQENARVGYQAAVDLWGILVQTSWSRFNAMVVANSIITGVLGWTLANEKIKLYKLTIDISVLGIILCILWFFLMWRDSKYQYYYVRSASELEYMYLSPVRTVLRGHIFEVGRQISIKDGFRPEKFKIGRIRPLRTSSLSYVIIFLFICIYILIIIQTFWLINHPTNLHPWYRF